MVRETGKVSVQDLGFETILGAFSFERERPQPVRLSFSLWMDFSGIAQSDSLEATVDYAMLSEDLVAFIQKSRFTLVETLVYRSAQRLLEKSPNVSAAWVRIEKPEAIPGARCSSAEIRLERSAGKS